MADYSLLPQNLNLSFVRGDEFFFVVDSNIDLTGYQFFSSLYKVTNVTNGQVTGSHLMSFTITPISLADGTIRLSLQENQTQSLNPVDTMRWYLRWVSPSVVTRTVLSGVVYVGDP